MTQMDKITIVLRKPLTSGERRELERFMDEHDLTRVAVMVRPVVDKSDRLAA